ncbi:MAG: SCO family protein [Leptospiraceae bacterium]|nr:SCO family protein [Leptospiraceae bacterium]
MRSLLQLRPFFLPVLVILLGFQALAAEQSQKVAEPKIGIDYSVLGTNINMDIPFKNEQGQTVTFRQLSGGKPIVLALVYYRCRSLCSPFLNGVAKMVDISPVYIRPGKEYTLVTLSFDELETPDLARQKKENYLANLRHPETVDASKWHFLTGSRESILQLTQSLGFTFKRVGDEFQHPSSLIVLAPSGKVSRFMRGIQFMPAEVMIAVTDAREDRWAPTIKKIVKFCFVEDQKGRGYYFDFLKVTGVMLLTIIFSVTGLLTLLLKVKKKPGAGE